MSHGTFNLMIRASYLKNYSNPQACFKMKTLRNISQVRLSMCYCPPMKVGTSQDGLNATPWNPKIVSKWKKVRGDPPQAHLKLAIFRTTSPLKCDQLLSYSVLLVHSAWCQRRLFMCYCPLLKAGTSSQHDSNDKRLWNFKTEEDEWKGKAPHAHQKLANLRNTLPLECDRLVSYNVLLVHSTK